jgi:hypothetical protein
VVSDLFIDAKLDSKSHLHLLPELADLHNCNNAIYFEARRHEDLYMWAAKTPNGPSIKMHVQNVHTMDELKMTGNCLKGSRGILSFDASFDETEWGKLTKEVFTHVRPGVALSCIFVESWPQIFGVPPQARRAKPFIDHILSFSLLDGKIWFRNFQVCRQLFRSLISTHALLHLGPREGPRSAVRSASDVPHRDRPSLRVDTHPHIRGGVQRYHRLLQPWSVLRITSCAAPFAHTVLRICFARVCTVCHP